MTTKRIFAAIDLPDDVREQVASYIEALRKRSVGAKVRWERPEKLHITINFAGGLDDDELPPFVKAVETAASSAMPFTIVITGTGAFSRRRSRANVLWLGLSTGDPSPIERLAADVDKECREQTGRQFKPHLTIARLKDSGTCRDLIDQHLASDFEPIYLKASEMVVFENKLLPTGSVYSVVSRHLFRGTPK